MDHRPVESDHYYQIRTGRPQPIAGRAAKLEELRRMGFPFCISGVRWDVFASGRCARLKISTTLCGWNGTAEGGFTVLLYAREGGEVGEKKS